jgi:hypothetical protein
VYIISRSGVAVQDGKAQIVFVFDLQIFLSLSLPTSLYASPFLSLIPGFLFGQRMVDLQRILLLLALTGVN